MNRWLLRIIALIPLWLTACSPVYVLRAGYEEAKILSRRRPIVDVMDDPATDSTTRRKLDLVLQARTFSDQQLGLATGESFTTYSWVDSDTLLMVVSGARKDAFLPYTWSFPIVGRIPYKGFFDFDQAYDLARDLEAKGYDAHVRPSGAFSTLGWFNDPLLNTVLRYGDVSLASTVIHELTHNTLFVPSQVGFNESFANFVGDRGAILFFCTRDGEDAETCRLAQNIWHDNLQFGAFLTELVAGLEAVYGDSTLTREQKIERRELVFSSAKERFRNEVRPTLRTTAFRNFAEQPINNATLIGTRLYYQHLDWFDALLAQNAGDLRATIRQVEELAANRPDAPFDAVRELITAP